MVVLANDGQHYTCSCREGSKKHLCKHAIVAMIKSGRLVIQNVDPLRGLGKRGRQPKITKQNRIGTSQNI